MWGGGDEPARPRAAVSLRALPPRAFQPGAADRAEERRLLRSSPAPAPHGLAGEKGEPGVMMLQPPRPIPLRVYLREVGRALVVLAAFLVIGALILVVAACALGFMDARGDTADPRSWELLRVKARCLRGLATNQELGAASAAARVKP
jgi:hypothetical protein